MTMSLNGIQGGQFTHSLTSARFPDFPQISTFADASLPALPTPIPPPSQWYLSTAADVTVICCPRPADVFFFFLLPLSDSTQWTNFCWPPLMFRNQQQHSPSNSTTAKSPSLEPAFINLAIAWTELLLDLLALVPNLYFLYLLFSRQDLHNNLRVLLGSLSVCLLLIAVTRVPTQINYILSGVLYVDNFRWLVFGHEIGVMFFRSLIVPLTAERVLATIRSKDYEQRQSPLVGVCAVLLTLAISTAIGLYIGAELNRSRISDGVISFQGDYYGLYHVLDVSVRLLLWIFCFVAFVALLLYNRRCYAFARLPNKHNLVQRYQFAENVRSSRQLLVLGTVVFLCNLHFDFVMLRIAYNHRHFDVEYSQSFDLVLAVALNAIPLLAIRCHQSMFSVFKSHSRKLASAFCSCFRQPRADQAESGNPSFLFPDQSQSGRQIQQQYQKSPRALLSGQRLIFRRTEEQKVHFDELRKSWDNVNRERMRRGSTAAGINSKKTSRESGGGQQQQQRRDTEGTGGQLLTPV